MKMFDINEIRKRAQQANEKAYDAVKKTIEKNEELINEIEVPNSEKKLKNRSPLIQGVK